MTNVTVWCLGGADDCYRQSEAAETPSRFDRKSSEAKTAAGQYQRCRRLGEGEFFEYLWGTGGSANKRCPIFLHRNIPDGIGKVTRPALAGKRQQPAGRGLLTIFCGYRAITGKIL